MNENLESINREVQQAREKLEPFRREVGKVIVGLQGLVDRLLLGLLTDGHILLEGVPGLAKTLAVRTLARTLRLQFSRIQFTPDLLPADVIGTSRTIRCKSRISSEVSTGTMWSVTVVVVRRAISNSSEKFG